VARRRRASPTTLALGALALGLALGIAISASPSAPGRSVVAALEPVGALWVNAIRMTLVPLVVSLLVTSVTSFADVRALGRIGARTVALFVAFLVGVALFAAVAAPPLFARMTVDPAAAAALRAGAAVTAEGELPTLRGFVVGLVPTNPLAAAVEGAMLPLIVFTLLFAVAVTQLPADSRAAVTTLFRAVSQAMLTIVRWILRLTPIGVFALSVGMGAELGLAAVGAVGYYVVVLCALLFVATLALYPVAALAGRTSMRRFAQACAPAQAVAAGTRSSLASLPALIEGARRVFGERPALTGFVLPVSVATFKINTPISDLVGPLFLAALYGIPLTFGQVAIMTLVSVAMSFSNPGIPSGGLFVVTAPVMLSVGLPLEGIGILIAADAIPDLFATVINVTGDMAVATIVAPSAPELAAEDVAGLAPAAVGA
jgi:Na+/H+-dicarboxylate symporter